MSEALPNLPFSEDPSHRIFLHLQPEKAADVRVRPPNAARLIIRPARSPSLGRFLEASLLCILAAIVCRLSPHRSGQTTWNHPSSSSLRFLCDFPALDPRRLTGSMVLASFLRPLNEFYRPPPPSRPTRACFVSLSLRSGGNMVALAKASV